MSSTPATRRQVLANRALMGGLLIGALAIIAILVWQGVVAAGNPDPLAPNTRGSAAVLDIAVLVFREGLECILVLAAITAGRSDRARQGGVAYRRPIAMGVLVALAATLLTWRIAIGVVDDLSKRVPALYVQAATGLLAVVVLIVVMNWFFHRVYWTGWITLHTSRKKELLTQAATSLTSRSRILWGLSLLGFTSFYREGFEVVLFLQSYRLQLGGAPVLYGVLLGTLLTVIAGALTFVARRKLPYRQMLVFTGILLGVVLLVMVGEQAQEMQLAHWLPQTPLPRLEAIIPAWMGLWFAIIPTVETIGAQVLVAVFVVGSYVLVQRRIARESRQLEAA
jgi:high-affinity iron transporter